MKAGERPVAVIGLGLMGGAIAANLKSAGYNVHGFDLDPAAMDRARRLGVHALSAPSDVPADSALILTSLPSAAALTSTVEALRRSALADCVLAELSTLAVEDKEIARDVLREARVPMLDCPISGTGAQAIVADLSVYASGDRAVWNRVSGTFAAFAQRPRYVGEFGAGTRLKYVANLLVAIHNVATAEAMALAEAAGVDLETAVDVLREGAGNSRIFELRAPMMARRAYVPATMKLGVWQKDMELIDRFARELGVRTPVFDATGPVYDAVREERSAEDTAAVFEYLRAKT